MYGSAICYRAQAHLRIQLFVNMMPELFARLAQYAVDALMFVIALLMIYYGFSLAETTWFQSYPEFDDIRVGVVYSAIPGGGAVLLLFVIEQVLYRYVLVEMEDDEMHHALDLAEKETGKRDL